MAKKTRKKVTTVREHPMHVPVSEKNPTGITIRDRHLRRLKGTYLDATEIKSIFNNFDRKGIVFPTKRKLTKKYKTADNFDEVIAVWTSYFNKKFNAEPPLDPDVVKALISSESDFIPDPLGNRKIALGIAQITKKTLKILQDPKGEAKEFIFKGILQKDLKDPNISLPMAIRWLHRKKETAANKLRRTPNHEEIILEYKGLLKSNSDYKKAGLKKYREAYATLKN
ncbi:MAG: lytic transglycosylase domain-containing protein [Bdellovibrionales bacterium]|nr:lytic transglycosylase domain-containing protein [Bdellovibrionales bacterium]